MHVICFCICSNIPLNYNFSSFRRHISCPTYRLPRVQFLNDPPPSVCNPSSVPECVSFHLETFQWSLHKGREEEKEIVLYILQNAPCLKTAAVSLSSYGPRGGEELLMIKELESMPKVSNSCKLCSST